MPRLIALAAASLTALALSLSVAPSRSQAQQASCPVLEQCKTQCRVAHTTCRNSKTSPIFVCEQNLNSCLNRCNLTAAKGCGTRPTTQPGPSSPGKGGTTPPRRP